MKRFIDYSDTQVNIGGCKHTDMDTLPRDICLAIVSKMDMDTRIKCGIIFKLVVPEEVKSPIVDAISNRPYHFGKKYFDLDRLCLGYRNNNENIRMPRYVFEQLQGAFYVKNLGNDMNIQTYMFDSDANKWFKL